MTTDEFTRYIFEGSQWTKETLPAARLAESGFVPECDIETFEREVSRPDGVIPVRKV